MDEEEVRRRADEIFRMSSEEFRRDCELRRQDRKRGIDDLVRKACGLTFDEKFANADDVFRALFAEEAGTRKLAVLAVLGRCKYAMSGKQNARIEKIARDDPDGDVRSAALMALGAIYEGKCDRRIGALLAAVVMCEAEPPGCRWSAYYGLLDLVGRHPESQLPPFPEGVDWSLVDSYARAS